MMKWRRLPTQPLGKDYVINIQRLFPEFHLEDEVNLEAKDYIMTYEIIILTTLNEGPKLNKGILEELQEQGKVRSATIQV